MRGVLHAGLPLALALTLGTAGAQPSTLQAPTGECRAGYWSSNRNLDERDGNGLLACGLSWRQPVAQGLRTVFSGRAGQNLSGDARAFDSRLREGYVEWESGDWSLRVGRQVLAWGRADRINPTDNLSPRDFTALVAEDEEQRLGIDAVRLRHDFNEAFSATAVWARFTAHRMPTGLWPPNLVPATEPGRGEWALKLDHVGDIDWSVSYFEGYERSARYAVQPQALGGFVFQGRYERARVLGLDTATAAGPWTLRTEMAHGQFRPDCTGCATSRREVSRIVLGADRDVLDETNLNVQLFGIHRTGYVDPAGLQGTQQMVAQGLDRLNSEFGRNEWGLSLRLSRRMLNERLKLELSAITDFTQGSAVLRPRVYYAISDALRWSAGADHFTGPRQSFFGNRKRNDLVFTELSFIF
ncbi:DUF1302 family protein [Azohydromonas australica]|uniref:DUF1302 family protein n=1 Tax=Azohydromonas australica TaxID=364039 RepID=UPI000423816A|nr:DUF1302 family protein [Azohydromonas australica]